jgi:hypothetical protein
VGHTGEEKVMRVHDPIGGPPFLERFFQDYDAHFHDLPHYTHQLQHVIARYSRGDVLEELRQEFPRLVRKIVLSDEMSRKRFPNQDRIFVHRGRLLERFRDALVVLSLGLCLRASKADIDSVLALCERGDPLLETIADAAASGLAAPIGEPSFYETFDGLYEALRVAPPDRERRVRDYLEVWYGVRMEGLSMKGKHLLEGRTGYVGYWCFEAAGVVAALKIDDQTFAHHPHYPRDLVAFYRAQEQ